MRFNPNASTQEEEIKSDQLPSQVDERQMSLFGAGWTLGSLKYLCESCPQSLTYYETTGWRGVMETKHSSPVSKLFNLLKGKVFPLYHVFADVGGAVDRPVAEATVGWMIALGHRMMNKDQLVRTGHWYQSNQYMGCELRDRVLGVVGLGGIGSAVIKLLEGFGMKKTLVYDPFMNKNKAEELGVNKVELHELMEHSDFITVHCPLNEKTRDLISYRELSLMKSSSFIINTARGGIINEDALFAALSKKSIAGAALDCFNDEPIIKPHRFGELDNVLLAPPCKNSCYLAN